MRKSTLVYLCAVVAATAKAEANARESKLVTIAQGPVRGYKDPETGIFAFQSIPYASAPTGPHRFKVPLPPPVWMHPLEAVDTGIICPQPNIADMAAYTDNKIMQENCLILNIHVPDTEEKNLPVVVYVHGGAFQVGFGDTLVPKKLIVENGIIVVTLNYRLGAHGFLSLGTKDIPGNAGMKDQVAALRWIKNNIASFGGNPNDITIAGYSAGSAAVDLLMLSKSAEGLFNKVIPESGANTAAWAIQSNPLENAKWFAKTLNFTDTDNIHALEKFYKTISFDLLTQNILLDRQDSTFLFTPCVERAMDEEVFLDKSPVDILKSGNYRKVPLLYGFANMEGLLRIDWFDSWKTKMNDKFSDFLPVDLELESEEEKEKVSQLIKQFYFGDKPVSEDNILNYVDFFSDVFFTYSSLTAVKYHVENGHDQIYLYEYSFVDNNTPYVPHTNVKGSNHCGQTYAVFGLPAGFGGQSNSTEEFLKISSTLRNIWSNFIKTGNPVPPGSSLPSWPAVGVNGSPHMSISNELRLQGPLLERRRRFWDQIYSKYYRHPLAAAAPAPYSRHEL